MIGYVARLLVSACVAFIMFYVIWAMFVGPWLCELTVRLL